MFFYFFMTEFNNFVTGWRSGARNRDSYVEPKEKREPGFYESNLPIGSGLISGFIGYLIDRELAGVGIGLVIGYVVGKYVGRHIDNKIRKELLEKKVSPDPTNSKPYSSDRADYK